MQVTIGAKCWDGLRSQTLTDVMAAKVLPQIEKQQPVRLDAKLKALLSFAVPVTLIGGLAQKAFAAAPAAVPVIAESTRATILHAFDPLINLIISLSYPIAGVMIAGGCLMIMVQQRERGMQMLQNAAIGYILVQLSPLLLNLLVGIGGSI
jgi:hypothetical protein